MSEITYFPQISTRVSSDEYAVVSTIGIDIFISKLQDHSYDAYDYQSKRVFF